MDIRNFRLPTFEFLLAKLAIFTGIPYKDKRCRGVESVNDHSDINSVHLQRQNKRRKVQTSLCVHTEYETMIIDWLGNDEVTTIGIYGMGGIGKTTLAKQLHTRILNHDIPSINHIYVTAWISIEKDFTVYQLQQKIVDAFGFDLQSDKDVTRRAGMIHALLSHKDKFLIFLDDMWSDFRREDVGIPRKCKLIVISRLLDVCRMLRCQKVTKIEPLSEEDSWQLFQHSIGGYGVSESKPVSSIRKHVYSEGAGLPHAIIALANSIKDASTAREVPENADPFDIGLTKLEDTISQLKLSYDKLNNITLQRCFLYSALYPKGYPISKNELIRLWIGVGLIDDVPSSQAQYDKGHCILNKLLNSCLLETCQDEESIKMHALVRHMALSISRDGFMVKADVPSKLEFYGNRNVISLINSLKSPS